jgi:hypothetical protein
MFKADILIIFITTEPLSEELLNMSSGTFLSRKKVLYVMSYFLAFFAVVSPDLEVGFCGSTILLMQPQCDVYHHRYYHAAAAVEHLSHIHQIVSALALHC